MSQSNHTDYWEGYDLELFVDQEVAEHFECGVCLNVARDPVQCSAEHIFCRACLEYAILAQAEFGNRALCPYCQCAMDLKRLQPTRLAKNVHASLKIRCQFARRGCKDVVPMSTKEEHEMTCSFNPEKRRGRVGEERRSTLSAASHQRYRAFVPTPDCTPANRPRSCRHCWERVFSATERDERELHQYILDLRRQREKAKWKAKQLKLAKAFWSWQCERDGRGVCGGVFRAWEARMTLLLVLTFLLALLCFDPGMCRLPFIASFLIFQGISILEQRHIVLARWSFLGSVGTPLEPYPDSAAFFRRLFLKFFFDFACFAVVLALSYCKMSSYRTVVFVSVFHPDTDRISFVVVLTMVGPIY